METRAPPPGRFRNKIGVRIKMKYRLNMLSFVKEVSNYHVLEGRSSSPKWTVGTLQNVVKLGKKVRRDAGTIDY